jgi:hypothetical protein
VTHFEPSCYQGFILESADCFDLYLIPPSQSRALLPWLGRQRAQAFQVISTDYDAALELDGRDPSYWHFLIWDSVKQQLIGGQRLLFVGDCERLLPFDTRNDRASYLEHCYPGFARMMVAQGLNYAEVGRTFVMPNYQRRQWLLQLIRAFVCLPESMGIRHAFGMISFDQHSCSEDCAVLFLSILKTWLGADPDKPQVPDTQFPVALPSSSLTGRPGSYQTEKEVFHYLRYIDPSFVMPPVLGPYLSLCSIRYHGVSIARTYNQIWQLLFSGSSDLIRDDQRRYLKPYSIN